MKTAPEKDTIQGIIKPGLTLVLGVPGTAKTRLLYHMLSALTQSSKCFGSRKVNTNNQTVMVCTTETQEKMRSRVAKCSDEPGVGLGLLHLTLENQWDIDADTRLVRVKEFIKKVGVHVVIVDSIEDLLGPAIYNKKTARELALIELRKLANDHGVCLIMASHLSTIKPHEIKGLWDSYQHKSDQIWRLEPVGNQGTTKYIKFESTGRSCSDVTTYLSVDNGSYRFEELKDKPVIIDPTTLEYRINLGLKLGLNQQDIALLVGVNQSTVSRVGGKKDQSENNDSIQDILRLELKTPISSSKRKRKGETA